MKPLDSLDFFTIIAVTISLVNLVNTILNLIYGKTSRTIKTFQERLDLMHVKKDEYKKQFHHQLLINKDLEGQLKTFKSKEGQNN